MIQPSELNDRKREFQLLDVREPEEWRAGRIDGAQNIPLAQLPAMAAVLDPAKPVATICRSGSRSGEAAVWLKNQGFEVANLEGGMTAWARIGLPMVGDEGNPWVA